MLDVFLLLFFGVMAYRIASAVSREGAIFREFNQPKSIGPFACLFPMGPIVLLTGVSRVGLLVSLVAAAGCYLPALFVARRRIQAFERAGTDRVKGALSASSQAFGTALAGLIYLGVVVVVAFVFQVYAPSSAG